MMLRAAMIESAVIPPSGWLSRSGVEDQDSRSVKVRRIAAVVPCFNRKQDAEALLGDFSRIELGWGDGGSLDVRVLLVDNASTVPLSTLVSPVGGGVKVQHLRLSTNTGGSGGYNAGMRRVLALDEDNDEAHAWRDWDADYVWLVDSDARFAPETLARLVEVMERDETIVAAGSAICDPITGQAFELGGHINRRIGHYEPMTIGNVGVHELVESDYLAACCALVRADAIRDTGVFPDRFLNGDDVEWFVRMRAMTGGRVVGVPWSVAMHPRFDRFPTWPRYYMTRNAFGPLDAVGGGAGLRLIRALREVPRAVQQDMMGRRDLAKLHMAGLRHAARHKTTGPAPEGLISVDAPQPFERLSAVLQELLGMGRPRPTIGRVLTRLMISDDQRRQIDLHMMKAGVVVRRSGEGARTAGLARASWGAMRRLVRGPDVDVAVVPARGRPDAWFLGRHMIEVTSQGFVLKSTPRVRTALRAGGTLLAGVWHAVRVARRGEEPIEPPRLGVIGPTRSLDGQMMQADGGEEVEGGRRRSARSLSLCAVVLSHNRSRALERTLLALGRSGLFAVDQPSGDAVLVVDNASTDGTREMLGRNFPTVPVLELEENVGVEAFDRAVATVDAEVVLILDDDAAPDPRALRRAMELLARRPDLAAVTLHPRHPSTGASEWPAARFIEGSSGRTTDRWPIMGCGNLVRRKDWLRAGGYEKSYFLYRNDTDLALKLLGQGRGVHFNPAWVVWHDTPTGAHAKKSVLWHKLATRNWVWTARRHGRGMARPIGAALGWFWAHKLAGFSLKRQLATLRGGWVGATRAKPLLEAGPNAGRAWEDLLKLMMRR